jgi:aquaporin TIP/aquaporin related protein
MILGCLNPAIGVGLGIVKSLDVGMDYLQNVWVFIFAPLLGAQLASEFYRNIYIHFYPKK